MLVGDVATTAVATIGEDATLGEAATRMHEETVGSLVVVDAGGRPTGIVTDRDLCVRALAVTLAEPRRAAVREVMSTPLDTLAPEDTLQEAAQRMRELGVRRLPVLRDGELAGIVTLDDLLQALARALVDLGAGMRLRLAEEIEERERGHALRGIAGLRERVRAAGWHARAELFEDLDRIEDLLTGRTRKT